MADIAENLRTFVLGDTVVKRYTSRMSQDAVPQSKPFPFIWFQRTGIEMNRCLGETSNTPFSLTFAVEVISDDLDESQALADAVLVRCESLANGGEFGDTTVSNVFCEAQADDYLPKAVDLNSGEHIAALSVEVYP